MLFLNQGKLEKVFFRKKNNKCPPNPTRVVILVSNTSSRPVLHLYQAQSKYSVAYLCYRAETRNQIQTQEGEITPKVNKNFMEGGVAPAGAKVPGATIRTWSSNKFIFSFLAVLSWKSDKIKTRII